MIGHLMTITPIKVTKQSDILDITETQVCGEVPYNNIATQKHLRNADM
jgi:hypothetical protein